VKEQEVISKQTPSTFVSALKKLLQILQYLNLDIVAGALAAHLMAQKVSGVFIESSFHYFALGAAVFVIYSLDRLSDVDTIKGTPATPRHRFYYSYKKEVWMLTVLISLIAGMGALWLLPMKMILFGSGLGLVALLYLWLVRTSGEYARKWLSKEVFVAVIYTAGIWGSVLLYHQDISWHVWLMALAFLMIALQNLLLFSLNEIDADVAHGQRSIARSLGEEKIAKLLTGLFAGVIFLLAVVYVLGNSLNHPAVLLILGAMSTILYALFAFREKLRNNEVYRMIGDGVFLLPFLALI
jgi:4-hydroxybenzoate polyprenyltransferase